MSRTINQPAQPPRRPSTRKGKQADGPLRQELSAKATATVVVGLLLAVGAFGLGWRTLSRTSTVAPVPQEMPKVVKEQVTGEFDPKAVHAQTPGETTQEGALRRERLEAMKAGAPSPTQAP